jgi:hypothetical protein
MDSGPYQITAFATVSLKSLVAGSLVHRGKDFDGCHQLTTLDLSNLDGVKFDRDFYYSFTNQRWGGRWRGLPQLKQKVQSQKR